MVNLKTITWVSVFTKALFTLQRPRNRPLSLGKGGLDSSHITQKTKKKKSGYPLLRSRHIYIYICMNGGKTSGLMTKIINR